MKLFVQLVNSKLGYHWVYGWLRKWNGVFLDYYTTFSWKFAENFLCY